MGAALYFFSLLSGPNLYNCVIDGMYKFGKEVDSCIDAYINI